MFRVHEDKNGKWYSPKACEFCRKTLEGAQHRQGECDEEREDQKAVKIENLAAITQSCKSLRR